jgi:pimeloyl-ACP methyl ester carboxylesterase
VGWSDGGIVALLVAISRPDLVRKLVVIGTNLDAAGRAAGVDEPFTVA